MGYLKGKVLASGKGREFKERTAVKVVHYRDAYQEDIPRIINPERALNYIRSSLARQSGFNQTIFGLDSFLRECGVSCFQGQHQVENTISSITRRLESGDFLLLGDRSDGFDTIQFFGGLSPFLSSTFRYKVEGLPSRPQRGGGYSTKAQVEHLVPDIPKSAEVTAELPPSTMATAIKAMTAAPRKKAIELQSYSVEQVLANPELQGVTPVNFIDPASMLVDDIVTFLEEGKSFIQSPSLSSAAMMAAIVVPGKLIDGAAKQVLKREMSDVTQYVANSLKNVNVKSANRVNEALGQYGGDHVARVLKLEEHSDFIKRYHGPDNFYTKDGKLVEAEFKGYSSDSKTLGVNSKGQPQGSEKKNLQRAQLMRTKKAKIGQDSNRIGGAYTAGEVDLWGRIEAVEGKKMHLAVFTNTETGQARAFWQDSDGNLVGNPVVDEFIPQFEEAKSLIGKALKGN
ncbi:hypothetical protein [Shewanella chilikensis]|uniref:hypothetical protein n=2 Tax=Shewanella chilikensis TaxID=558541 RepID=UPI001CFA234D|nr:hypothetical protein [Shewanella chilikensis]